MLVKIHVDADKASDGFKAARRELRTLSRTAMKTAGEDAALPPAKRNAHGLKVAGQSIASTMVVRARGNGAYLTSTMRGKNNRAVGLLEFGGTVRGKIEPKGKKKALAFGGQHPVASVETPRVYRPRLFMTNAVKRHQQDIADALWTRLQTAYDGFEVT